MKAEQKYLITGRAGSGKSTICQELNNRGLAADDGDRIAGLAGWVNLASKEKVEVDSVGDIDESKVDWLWNEDVLEQWLSRPGERFLCGSAGNDLEFFERFSKVFILLLNPATHMQRLQSRDSEYAKSPAMIQKKLLEQQIFSARAIDLGAVAINADASTGNVVDQILSNAR